MMSLLCDGFMLSLAEEFCQGIISILMRNIHSYIYAPNRGVVQSPEREGHSCPTDQDIRASTEPCTPPTIPLHFQGVHHVLLCEMTNDELSYVESALLEFRWEL